MRRQLKKSEAEAKKTLILGTYNADGDRMEYAKTLGVARSTVYRLLRNDNKPDMRGGSRGKRFLEEHKDFCVEQIEANPRCTLEQLKDLLKAKFNLDVSRETIWVHLDGACYS